MKEGISVHKVLLGVELYEISSDFIHKIREGQPRPENVFSYLPMYTINTNDGANNRPMIAEFFHQFVGFGEENKKYLYFNLNTIDKEFNEEISNAGIETLFQDFDFAKILSNFKPQPEDDITNFHLPWCHYLVVELIYTTSYDHYNGGWEGDMDIDIIGYLDNDLNLKYFEKE